MDVAVEAEPEPTMEETMEEVVEEKKETCPQAVKGIHTEHPQVPSRLL